MLLFLLDLLLMQLTSNFPAPETFPSPLQEKPSTASELSCSAGRAAINLVKKKPGSISKVEARNNAYVLELRQMRLLFLQSRGNRCSKSFQGGQRNICRFLHLWTGCCFGCCAGCSGICGCSCIPLDPKRQIQCGPCFPPLCFFFIRSTRQRPL